MSNPICMLDINAPLSGVLPLYAIDTETFNEEMLLYWMICPLVGGGGGGLEVPSAIKAVVSIS